MNKHLLILFISAAIFLPVSLFAEIKPAKNQTFSNGFNLEIEVAGIVRNAPVFLSIHRVVQKKSLKPAAQNRFIELNPYLEKRLGESLKGVVRDSLLLPAGLYKVYVIQDIDRSFGRGKGELNLNSLLTNGDLIGTGDVRVGRGKSRLRLGLSSPYAVTDQRLVQEAVSKGKTQSIRPISHGKVHVEISGSASDEVYLLFYKDPSGLSGIHPVLLLNRQAPCLIEKAIHLESGALGWEGALPEGRYIVICFEDTDGTHLNFRERQIPLPTLEDWMGVLRMEDLKTDLMIYPEFNPFEFVIQPEVQTDLSVELNVSLNEILGQMGYYFDTDEDFYWGDYTDITYQPPDFNLELYYSGRVHTPYDPLFGYPSSVFNEPGEFPLEGVEITFQFDGGTTLTTVTDERGNFYLQGPLPASRSLKVIARLNGFEDYEANWDGGIPLLNQDFNIDYDQSVFPLAIQMNPSGGKILLQGKVVDELRRPVEGVPIQLYIQQTLDQITSLIAGPVAITQSNREGIFYFLVDGIEGREGMTLTNYLIMIEPFRYHEEEYLGLPFQESPSIKMIFSDGTTADRYTFLGIAVLNLTRFVNFSQRYGLTINILNKGMTSTMERNWLEEPWIASNILTRLAVGIHDLQKRYIFSHLGRMTEFFYYEDESDWVEERPDERTYAFARLESIGWIYPRPRCSIHFHNDLSASITVHEVGHVLDWLIQYGLPRLILNIPANIQGLRDEIFSKGLPIAQDEDNLWPPPGFISRYSTTNDYENFAEHFMFFISYPDKFIQRTGLIRQDFSYINLDQAMTMHLSDDQLILQKLVFFKDLYFEGEIPENPELDL